MSTAIHDLVIEEWGDDTASQTGLPEVDAVVGEFNKRFFVVENFGDQCVVCWLEDVPDPKKGKHVREEANKRICHQSFANFAYRFVHQRIVTGLEGNKIKTDTKANVWIRSSSRKQFERVVFKPDGDALPNEYNLWRGFAYKPVKGDCGLYLDHMRDNICRKDPIKYNYGIKWMAWNVRNPGAVGEVAFVIPGTEGTGKNVFAEGYSDLWGSHGVVLDDEQSVTGKFNAILEGRCVCVADEAFFSGSAKQANRLKGLITGRTLTVEHKGINSYKTRNILRLFILGNDEHIIRAGVDARRFFVTECGSDHIRDGKYFEPIVKQLLDGGYAALLYHLLYEVDLTGFDIRAVPETSELREQKAYSLTGVRDLVVQLAMSGQMPGGDVRENDVVVYNNEGSPVVEDRGVVEVNLTAVVEWANKKKPAEWGRINYRQLQDVLGAKGLGLDRVQRRVVLGPAHKLCRYWLFPSLPEFRKLIDEKIIKVGAWPEENERWNRLELAF